ncbi:hypothetical protein S7711_04595 [Stachybotrys chartarum IBT 7711]|uniref:Uncharacterized protein n=1 Tax=Stachybotrys chartarum (strain CBS 109288 / IBT 7711) TaxID=1280523 RepID=A0A084AUE8_STACB|nr:hypothetical protein S7711_04595 [Stachybotrys chartarum IBT 7711]
MSQRRRSRALTSPPERPRLAIPPAAFRQSTQRRYGSAELSAEPCSLSTLSGNCSGNKLQEAPSVLPSTSAPQVPAMFAHFFSHTAAAQPYAEIEMETGDFDTTPTPSARPSLTLLRYEESVGVPSVLPESKCGGYRHHLLKTSTSGPMLVDRHVPAPPLLSRTSSKRILEPPIQEPRSKGGNNHAQPLASAAPPDTPYENEERLAFVSSVQQISPNLGVHGLSDDITQVELQRGRQFAVEDNPVAVPQAFRPIVAARSPVLNPLPAINHGMNNEPPGGDEAFQEMYSSVSRASGTKDGVKFRPPIGHDSLSIHDPVLNGYGSGYRASHPKAKPFGVEADEQYAPSSNRSQRQKPSALDDDYDEYQTLLDAREPKDVGFDDVSSANYKRFLASYKATEVGDNCYTPPLFHSPDPDESYGSTLAKRLSPLSGHSISDGELGKYHPPISGTKATSLRSRGGKTRGDYMELLDDSAASIPQAESAHQAGFIALDSLPAHTYCLTTFIILGMSTRITIQLSWMRWLIIISKGCMKVPVLRQQKHKASNSQEATMLLRDLLPHPYTSKFTELPSGAARHRTTCFELRRPSEPILPSTLPSRRTTRSSDQARCSETSFDGIVFKRAVGDLDRLLNEAVAIASQVVDRRHLPLDEGADLLEDGSPYASLDSEVTSKEDHEYFQNVALESPKSVPRVDLSRESVGLKHPVMHHAATYAGHPDKPKLIELLEMYSGKHHKTPPQDTSWRIRRRSGPAQILRRVNVEIPSRNSSRNKTGYSTIGEYRHSIRPEVVHCLHYEKCDPRDETLSCSTAEVVDFDSERSYWNMDTQICKGAMDPGSNGVNTSAGRGIAEPQSTLTHRGGRDVAIPENDTALRSGHHEHGINLKRRSHVSLRGIKGFSLAKSHRRHPIARDWSPVRKRFAASVACISTFLVGVLLGIYAGLVPSIQYYIIDQSYATIHGNTGCFLGLALPTLFLWPLPLLHGRKPYILFGLVLAMPLLFLQAISVNEQRLTHIWSWRVMLLLPRALMGASLGLASMNFHSILTDLFGASLMSRNPHEEVADEYDTRRHGGGMGVWLGIWTWSWIGSLGIGFLIGATIIDKHPPVWGFYISIMLIAGVVTLNIVCPEVRRSAFRRSVTEVKTEANVSRRLARGEVMMHRVQTGPKWWGQEVYHGMLLSGDMLRQPGFLVVAVYCGWIYAQVVLLIILLGSLVSRHYRLRSPHVGLHVACIALGALLAIPFQKANLFSRSRQQQLNTNRATLEGKRSWSSHLARRAMFTILLPLAGICYAAVSSGPPIHIVFPTVFAMCVGFLSSLAISECSGLIMETFDTSDLSPGMTGRQRDGSRSNPKRTNYSSFPRVTAGYALIHGLAFILAAGATALGGLVRRNLGQQVSTGVVAAILLFLTLLLLLVLIRFKEVQIIPASKEEEMDKIIELRRKSTERRASMPTDVQAILEEEIAWRPVMIGNPIGKSRRFNLLELGGMSRWQEIRKKNELIDKNIHLNREAIDHGLEALDDQMSEFRRDAHELIRRASGRNKASKHSHRSDHSSGSGHDSDVEVTGHVPGGRSGATPVAPSQFVERDCFMGQTVTEENEDEGGPSTSPPWIRSVK